MDDGAFRPDSPGDPLGCNAVVVSSADAGALEALGRLRPEGWLWNGKGFYDNNSSERGWMSHYGTELVSYPEYARRLETAREENCRHQEASEWSYGTMQAMRDEENCFRFVEIGISAAEVVVVARPCFEEEAQQARELLAEQATPEPGGDAVVHASGRPRGRIVLRPPTKKGAGEAQFEFRILRGHTAEQLLKHRDVSGLVFVGFAVMGLLTIAAGEEMIRDSVEVVELL